MALARVLTLLLKERERVDKGRRDEGGREGGGVLAGSGQTDFSLNDQSTRGERAEILS